MAKPASRLSLAALIAAWLALVIPMQVGFSLLIAAFFLLALRDALMAEAQGALPSRSKDISPQQGS
jgi:hypothetical protein